MNGNKLQLDGLQAIVAVLGLLLVLMFAPTLFFAIKGDQLGFFISLTVIAMLFLGLMIMGAVAMGAEYTRRTMRDGASIALQSQDFNDRWDIKKMDISSKLFIEGARAGRSLQQGAQSPPLPLPSQGLEWLPPVEVLNEPDGDGHYLEGGLS